MEVYVYFIQAGTVGPVKIGVARNVDKRMETLQTGNHKKLNLITKIICDGLVHAYGMENNFHRKFKKHRIRGEWFQPIVLSLMLPKENKKLDLELIAELENRGLI